MYKSCCARKRSRLSCVVPRAPFIQSKMRAFLIQQVLAAGFLAATATAVTPVSDADMTEMLKNNGIRLAMKAQPMFFFSQMNRYGTCIPTVVRSTKGQRTPPSNLCNWPDAGCECRNPGVKVGHPSPSFPIYFSFKKCSATSVRVAYNLFWTKDGWKEPKSPLIHFGHPYDWERAIVVWEKDKCGQWWPKELLLSQHGGYGQLEWAKIHNTFNEEDGSKPRGGANGRTNLDHPKVYIESFKHAMRDTKETDHQGEFDQISEDAYRSDDWWYYPKTNDYVLADESSEVGKFIARYDWGEADSTPPLVAKRLCDESG
ncbi:hypothetical protein C2857_007638 [Epichloe festucae Fl1]|uniref:Uncharacterized protein n=1 Tax=Epichloe festucae (strain Fl1) TaxID=877507 RepID=A0A7S9KMX2_EPIFF|nr:hypothetical protein C2857_007638 [Epichloe festucae Fl1]